MPALGGATMRPPLSASDGREHIDQTGGYQAFGGLELDLFGWEYGGEAFEVAAAAGTVGRGFVDLFHAHHAEVALAVFGGAHLSADLIAVAQTEAAYLGLGNIHIAASAAARLPQKAVAFAENGQDAAGFEAAVLFGHIGKHFGHHLMAARHRAVFYDAKLLREFEKFVVVQILKLR